MVLAQRIVAPTLFGRDAVLQALERRLDVLHDRSGALVLISGEAGIGKTSIALAAGARAVAAGASCASGHCYERGIAPPFSPWLELFSSLETLVMAPREILPPPFGTGPPPQTAYQLAHACVIALAQAATRCPLILLLDDLQWADVESLDLLDLATRQLAAAPILFLGTYRVEAVAPGHLLYDRLPALQRDRPFEHIELHPLSREATAHMVAAQCGFTASTDLVTYLHARSGGHPLFLRELLHDLEARGLLGQGDQAWQPTPAEPPPVPTLLRQIILQRVTYLSRDAQELLTAAAVAGEVWDLSVVEQALGWPEARLLPALELALAGHVIRLNSVDPERYCFTHALFREVLYDHQLVRRRKQLHARIAAALAALEPDSEHTNDRLAALAYHAHAAGQWPAAAQYSLAAGDVAREGFAIYTALANYHQALEVTTRASSGVSLELPLQLHERLGELEMALNQKEPAEASFQQMLAMAQAAGDRQAEGRALCHLTFLYAWLHRFAQGAAIGERARALAEELDDPRLLALSYRELGNLLIYTGDLTMAQRHLERAEQAARASGLRGPLSRCLRLLASLATWRGDFHAASQLTGEALELARAGRDVGDLGGAYWNAGLIAGERGCYEQARQLLQAGLDLAIQSGERRYWVRLLNTMGWLYSELGADAEARRWDQQALAAARTGPHESFTEMERYSLLNLATDELRLDNLAEAQMLVRALEPMLDYDDAARYRYLNRSQLLKAELALARGDSTAATHWAQAAAELATTKRMLKNVLRSELLHGRARLAEGRAVEAERLIQGAVERADALGHGSLRWQGRLWLAQARAALDRPTAGVYREALAIVDAIAEELSGSPLQPLLCNAPLIRELRTRGLERPARAGSPVPHPSGLTAREVEVLRLIVQGATNRAIADTLHISVKTAHAHVASILSKTGSANRAAAAAFALRHQLTEPYR
jgi:DNA-binding CsgD family transcriptional regulator